MRIIAEKIQRSPKMFDTAAIIKTIEAKVNEKLADIKLADLNNINL